MPSLALLAVLFQTATTQVAELPRPARPTPPPIPVARAIRATTPPSVDGRGDDEVWRTAPVIDAFRQWQPREDVDTRFRTEARIAYDDRYFYAHVRAYDPHPDSILQLLARRDVWTASDKIWVVVDSYHDRRSGFEFGVNPAGVKMDLAVTDDGNEDDAWDAVWDVATTMDSLGWTAEFRIPLSQLRYAPADSNIFGLMIIRDIQRHTERDSWPVLRRSRSGYPSQFGELHGLTGLTSPRKLELRPYVVTQNSSRANTSSGYDRHQSLSLGGDVKYGLTSNLTLDGTINPDFGQVEADPSVLNLSAFETFFQERRPFFVEGTGIFNFNVNCSAVNCSGENLFYSRRIGRQPQNSYGGVDEPTATSILGAGKITGRLGNGLSIGILEAATQHEVDDQERTLEPGTNYFAARLMQDLRRGESGIGAMLTAVNRNLDPATDADLRRSAYVGALNFRHRFLGGRYSLSGSAAYSRVNGTAEAIASTQRGAVHFYQRPDAGLTLDTTRTSLTGHSEEIAFGKFGGGVTRFETSFQRRSAGFEINDFGFLQRADQQSWNTWAALRLNTPRGVYRSVNWNVNWWQFWTTNGTATERAFNTNAHVQLTNRWWVHAGGTLGQLGSTHCDFDCTRGGPAVRQDGYLAPWFGVEGDNRKKIQPFMWVNLFRGDHGHSWRANFSPQLSFRVSSRFSPSIGFDLTNRVNDIQPYGQLSDSLGTSQYTFARLRQTTASLNLRFDYTMTNTLSLQVYAAPFVTKGSYSNVRQLVNARAGAYDDRYAPFADTSVTNNPGGFNFKQFRSNVVLRWEYRPGSTLFLVWTQGRENFAGQQGTEGVGRNFRDLFDLRPDNTLLVKASYWLSW